jgi:hypothetical protein
MGTPTVISMSVRPQQASHLCFNVDGILGDPILLPNGAPLLSLGLYVAPSDPWPASESRLPLEPQPWPPLTSTRSIKFSLQPRQLPALTNPAFCMTRQTLNPIPSHTRWRRFVRRAGKWRCARQSTRVRTRSMRSTLTKMKL